jgi:hypothetical protein
VAQEPVDDAVLQKLGLYDPSWPHADDLLELLHYLLELGATTEDLLEYQWELPAVASVVALRPGRERLCHPFERRSPPERCSAVTAITSGRS